MENRIKFVDSGWLAFARDNEAPELTERAVLGESVWKFIAGVEVRHLYELAFQRVRTEKQDIEIPFRCDSPTRRRFMELRIAPLDAGNLSIVSILVRDEERPYVALLDRHHAYADEFVTICSWCKQLHISGDRWAEVEVGIRELNLLGDKLPRLTHGLCPKCAAVVRDQISASTKDDSNT